MSARVARGRKDRWPLASIERVCLKQDTCDSALLNTLLDVSRSVVLKLPSAEIL